LPLYTAIWSHVEEAGIGLKCITQLVAQVGWQVLRVSMAGQILDASPTALKLLDRFFPSQGT